MNLPIELILLATEYAAWEDLDAQMQTSEKAIRRWRQWVASLCTVCRALEPVMARILYALVHVHPGNVDAVVRAAEMDTHPFRRARAVYFDKPGISLVQEHVSALCAAFLHVRAYSGPFNDLEYLFKQRIHSHNPQPLAVHFTHSRGTVDLSTVTISAERLHLVFDLPKLISIDDLSRFHTRFLILDIHHATSNESLDKLSQILRFHTLERILVRPFAPWNRRGAQTLRDRICVFAKAERSAIIWFDDSFAPSRSGHLTVFEMRYYRGLSDAMTGDDLWLRGSQLYIPGTDA